jgi:RNA polymerase sigma factor (sigma-70 family)
MHADRLRKPLERLRRALAPADGAAPSDGRLLERFLADRDEAAFAALVRRHGPMVLGVCRRLVRHAQDAEDCFQAAFLVLARRAGSVRQRESLASWLYGVAYRVALDAGGAIARRRSRERQVDEMPHPEVPPAEPQDWRPLLDQELAALPEKYRAVVVLCDLEGRPRKESARRLRLSEGTLSSRLARARALLAGRLSRRGVALSGGALAAALAGGTATAAVPAQLVLSTAKVAALVAAGQSAAVGSQAAVLMHEFQRGMLMAKLKVGAALAAAAVLLGAGGLAYQAAAQDWPRPAKSADVRPERGAEARSLSELELLRKEVDILKLQVEVLQDKVRALRPAPQAGKAGPAGMGMPGLPDMGRMSGMQSGPGMPGSGGMRGTPDFPGMQRGLGMSGMPGPGAPAAGGLRGPGPGPGGKMGGPGVGLDAGGNAPDAVQQAEAALKALRQARDPEARQRAAEALEKAARQLRGPAGNKAPRE